MVLGFSSSRSWLANRTIHICIQLQPNGQCFCLPSIIKIIHATAVICMCVVIVLGNLYFPAGTALVCGLFPLFMSVTYGVAPGTALSVQLTHSAPRKPFESQLMDRLVVVGLLVRATTLPSAKPPGRVSSALCNTLLMSLYMGFDLSMSGL